MDRTFIRDYAGIRCRNIIDFLLEEETSLKEIAFNGK